MGYYGGDGARQIATVTPSATLPQTQPQCITDQTTYLYDCGNWGVSASWNVPSTAVSGVYMAHLTRTDNGDESQIMFIVRNDASHSDIVFQTSDETWQAYNTYGGSDFYTGGGDNGRAYQISYNRPVLTRTSPGGQDYFFSNEFPLVRVPRTERVRRQLYGGCRHRPLRRPAAQPQGLLVGRSRRVLERGPTGQRAERARPRGEPPVPQRQRDVLAHALRPSADASHTPYRPWSPTRRPGRTPRSTPRRSGPAPIATRASRRRRRGPAYRRTR